MLAMQCWNRNQVYSSITPTLVMLRWHECHIVNQALDRCQLGLMLSTAILFPIMSTSPLLRIQVSIQLSEVT